MIRLRDISLRFDHEPEALAVAIVKRLRIRAEELVDFTIVRKAIDARRKGRILAVYTVDVCAVNEAELAARFSGDSKVTSAPDMCYRGPKVGRVRGPSPVVVGSGPCGLFAGLILAEAGLEPVVVERGKEVGARVKDVHDFWREGRLDLESNVQFGEGGAGTFSDGKLATQIKDKSNRSRKVLDELVRAGASEEILYLARPHIGTDNLVRVVKGIRNRIISLGGTVRFETKFTGLEISGGGLAGATVNDGEIIETDAVVLATGHSARDTLEMLFSLGVEMQGKAFSMGVRIEHPQEMIDRSQYGRFGGDHLLGAAEYKLVHHCANGRSAYTFCMCPGGQVIGASSEAGGVVTNGMSLHSRGGVNANSGLLVGVGPVDFGDETALAGVEFQRKWERRAFEAGGGNYFAPVQLMGDFLAGRASRRMGGVAPSYTPGTTCCDLGRCLPGFVAETLREAIPQMDKKLKGFAMADAVMTAVESRSSSPVRILRDESLQSTTVRGLYPGGEGAGYAGGIMSAAVDGVRIAEAVLAERMRVR